MGKATRRVKHRRVVARVGRFGWLIGAGLGVGLVLIFLALSPAGCGQDVRKSKPLSGAPVVRVLLLDQQRQVILSATKTAAVRVGALADAISLDLPDGKGAMARRTPGGWQIGKTTLGPGELTIEPEVDGSVRVNDKPYRGNYRLVPSRTSPVFFDVVNDVDVDSYLKSVVSKELLWDWHDQAHRAQAVVARTYGLYEWRMNDNRPRSGREHFDLFCDTRSQVYGGMSAETAKSRDAVDATSGVVVAYGQPGQERIFKAYFSSCCGGITQSSADAFGGPLTPPLVDQNFGTRCSASPRFNWGPVVVPKDELTRRFRLWAAGRNHPAKDMWSLVRIDVEAVNPSGRPTRYFMTDARNRGYSLSSEEVRWAVNTSAPKDSMLYSGYFRPVNESAAVRFADGHGWGHGVGMCQWCAQQQAQDGVRHEHIVLDAFPGATLQRAY
jgi:stage II sporulation protein D